MALIKFPVKASRPDSNRRSHTTKIEENIVELKMALILLIKSVCFVMKQTDVEDDCNEFE